MVGPNTIREQNRRTLGQIVLEQFRNVLTILLLIAAGVALALGEQLDAWLIFTIVFLNVLFGVYQERKAEAAIEALKGMTKTKVRVVRDGKEVEIDSEDLVPGDVAYVEEGMKIAADATIVSGSNLEANEAGLTGESLPVAKADGDTVYAGTIVTRGKAMVQVRETGMNTKFGEIAAKLSGIDKSKTLLEQKLEKFTRMLGALGVFSSIFVMIFSYGQGQELFASILLGVSLAVALVPEGLTAVMTITMAIGVREMAKRKAILRKLSAIEALGSISLIATDKTGTLTTNSMRVKEVWVDGRVGKQDDFGTADRAYGELVRNGVLCSTASLEKLKNDWRILGDPTEGALLVLGKDEKVHYEKERVAWKEIHEVPFSSVTKRMSVTVRKGDEIITYTKGATESVLAVSGKIMQGGKIRALDAETKKEIKQVMDAWADKGLRVLSFSMREHTESSAARLNEAKDPEKLLDDQVFLGMVAMYDPPRPEAAEALLRAKAAGIRVVMVTGDNERTGEAIGRAIGLMEEGDTVLTGTQVETMSDRELAKRLTDVRVFARVSPFHKSRIVSLYQKKGFVVAVTGDGVNDAIALKQADVGVAMGLVGTDVARETADMVITDDNFATIINAVEEGRNIIKNIRNAIKYLLATNLVEAMTIIGGLVIGMPHLFTAIQLLYINLLSDGIPSLALALSPKEEHAMNRPPAKKLQLLTSFDTRFILFRGLVATAIVFATLWYYRDAPEEIRREIVFVVLALVQPFFFIDLWVTHQSYLKHFREFLKPVFYLTFLYPFAIIGIMLSQKETAAIFDLPPMDIPFFLTGVAIAASVVPMIVLFNMYHRGRTHE
jgi:Ca2+-transporting ATPase